MMDSNPGKQPSWLPWLLFCTVPLGFVLGAVGSWFQEPVGQRHVVDALYYALQLFVLKAPSFEPPLNLALEAGRWLAATSFLVTAGTAMHQLLKPRLRAFRLRGCERHAIVCGSGHDALAVVRHFSSKQKVVLLAPQADPVLEASADDRRTFVLVGRPQDLLDQAGVSRAAKLVAICDDDGANVEIVARARSRNTNPSSNPLLCFAQIKDDDLRQTVEQHSLIRRNSSCLIKTFDAFDEAAREVLLSRKEGLPLDHDGITPADRRTVRLVILRIPAIMNAQSGHRDHRFRAS